MSAFHFEMSSPDLRYVRLKDYKERNDLARSYRAMRRQNPAVARMVWRETSRAMAPILRAYEDDLMNAGNCSAPPWWGT